MAQFIGTTISTTITYEGIPITHECDTRGAEYGESVFAVIDGQTCDFNMVEDAQAWIDAEYGIDPDYQEEHRLRRWELV